MMKRRSWRDLSPRLRITVAVLTPIELVLTTLAVVDLARRPKELIRGPKALWWPAVFVQPVGPVVYLLGGRRT